jgi:ABC-type taurine transport system ATPase subunit
MRQRAGIAQALLNDPQLLIVDEMVSGWHADSFPLNRFEEEFPAWRPTPEPRTQ